MKHSYAILLFLARFVVVYTAWLLPAVAPAPAGEVDAVGRMGVADFEASAGGRLIYFQPFDAPFITGDYNARVLSILNSISPSVTRSFIDDTALEYHRRKVKTGKVIDYKMTPAGERFLTENKEWLVDRNGLTAGYDKFRRSYKDLASVAAGTPVREFQNKLLTYFAEGQAFRYTNASQVVRLLSGHPASDIYRTLVDRALPDVQGSEMILFPRPDDLDLTSEWRRIVLTTPNDPGSITGLAVTTEVVIPQADRLSELMLDPATVGDFYLPSQLIFAKRLINTPSNLATNDPSVIRLIVDEAQYRSYAAISDSATDLLFLLAVRLDRHRL